MHIAQHGVGGQNSARRRVGQHDHIGQAGGLQRLDGNGRAGHLHEGQGALLHARAARGGEDHQRTVARDGFFSRLEEGLAGGDAERSAHEGEVLDQHDGRNAADLAVGDGHGVLFAGRLAGGGEAVDVGFLVAEMERIVERGWALDLFVDAFVKGVGKAQVRPDAHRMAGGRDPQIGLQVRAINHLAGSGALFPQVLGRLALGDLAHAGGDPRQPAAFAFGLSVRP